VGWGILAVPGGYLLALASGIGLLVVWRALAMISLDKLSSLVFFSGLAVWGVTVATFQIVVAYGSKVVVSYMVAQLLVQRLARRFAANRILPLLLGLLIYVPLRAIPIFGWALSVAVTLIGVGAIALAVRSKGGNQVVAAAGQAAVPPAAATSAAPDTGAITAAVMDSTSQTAASETPDVG
jgi:hypothetical protein